MKDIQIFSRETDRKVLLVLFGLGVPALAGCLLPTPFEDSHVRLFDAVLSAALALLVWSGFRLLEPRRYSHKWEIAERTVVPVVWLLLILAFAVWFYHLEQAECEVVANF